jgi:acyl-[acyl-carrier-protein]-phospholipid O-acyltransferase/long-chain-fatty-acid--[acyl-carrier-protein] ligase
MDGYIDNSLKIRVRKARVKFLAMAATYCAGVLNDNIFRQTVMMLAVLASKTNLQAVATILFNLPFILFAAPAGYCADRFSKRSVVIASKLLELIAMLIAAVGIYSLNWVLMMVTLFIMALQSTIFGPALNGTIPELYPAEYVLTANGIIRMATTGAMLVGTALAGVVLGIPGQFHSAPLGRAAASAVVVIIAAVGLIVSLGVPRFPAASADARFPRSGPLASIKTLWNIRRDKLLITAIAAEAYFWFAASLQILVINTLGLGQFRLSTSKTGAMSAVELIGVVIGSLLVVRITKRTRWHRVLAPAAVLMAVCMLLVMFVPHLPRPVRSLVMIGALGLAGIGGGVFLVPLSSFIQLRPSPDTKGRIIATEYFAVFSSMLIAGGVYYLFAIAGIKPTNCFGIEAILTAIVAGWLFFILPKGDSDA